MDNLGVVVIGRNEERVLASCLESVSIQISRKVYVDSDSSDASREIARKHGFDVIRLSETEGLSAAKARNRGFDHLFTHHPELEFIQFVDGDCRFHARWLREAQSSLSKEKGLAIVCGRRAEVNPQASIYNQLCDIEWNTPIGEALSCGGDFLVKTSHFRKVKGFDSSLIAGEEPELCLRLRSQGYKIQRLDLPMTYHDANLTNFAAWWRRSKRAGFVFAMWATMYPDDPQFKWSQKCLPIWVWACVLPTLLLLAAVTGNWLVLFAALLLYPLQIIRVGFKMRGKCQIPWKYSAFMMLSKFAELSGQLSYWRRKLLQHQQSLIEYK